MTEQHSYELAPTTEPAGVALGPVLNDGPLKLGAGKQVQHLAENAGYSCHGGGAPPYGSRLSTQTVAEFYRRRSKANLDKSDWTWFKIIGLNVDVRRRLPINALILNGDFEYVFAASQS
jgi:hypothetical protein